MSVDALRASVDALTETTKTAVKGANDRIDRIEAVLRRPGGALTADNDNSDIRAERDAVAIYCRTGDDTKLKQIQAGMNVGSDPDGGYFSLPTYSTSMTTKLFDASPMRQISRVETITSGDSFIEPIDYDEVGAEWVGEQQARPETDHPQAAMLTVQAHEIYANTKVTQKLIDDAGFDLGAYLENKAVDKFSRSEGAAFISGSGVDRPRGLLTYDITETDDATRPWKELQYVASGHATQVTADGLKNLLWKVRAPYRKGAVWVMNSNTANSIDKLKDGQGNYLWSNNFTSGQQPTLLGHQVYFNEDMPDISAGSYSIAFGNFKLGYLICDRLGVRFLRDPYSNKPHTYFYSYKRVGGGVANTQAIKLLKTSS